MISPLRDLWPIVNVSFFDVEARISRLNLDDPQPPGYRYRLPLSAEYDPWVERRDQVVEGEAYEHWGRFIGSPLVCPPQQRISYYEDGLWHQVGGAAHSWCSDLSGSRGDRVIRGGSWRSNKGYVQEAPRLASRPSYSADYLGYRLVRGLPLDR